MKDLEVGAKLNEINAYKQEILEKQKEIEKQSKQMLKMKDDRMDFEARVDDTFTRERKLKEDVVTLSEKLSGKDQALAALSRSLMDKAMEHQKLSETYNQFKNKILSENCFHLNFLATQIVKNLIGEQKYEVTLGFVRDKSFEEEFFLAIESKEPDASTGQKERKLIPVEDILEIEHTEGLKFEIRYMDQRGNGKAVGGQSGGRKVAGAIGGFLSKMKKKEAAAKGEEPDEEPEKLERCDTF